MYVTLLLFFYTTSWYKWSIGNPWQVAKCKQYLDVTKESSIALGATRLVELYT